MAWGGGEPAGRGGASRLLWRCGEADGRTGGHTGVLALASAHTWTRAAASGVSCGRRVRGWRRRCSPTAARPQFQLQCTQAGTGASGHRPCCAVPSGALTSCAAQPAGGRRGTCRPLLAGGMRRGAATAPCGSSSCSHTLSQLRRQQGALAAGVGGEGEGLEAGSRQHQHQRQHHYSGGTSEGPSCGFMLVAAGRAHVRVIDLLSVCSCYPVFRNFSHIQNPRRVDCKQPNAAASSQSSCHLNHVPATQPPYERHFGTV